VTTNQKADLNVKRIIIPLVALIAGLSLAACGTTTRATTRTVNPLETPPPIRTAKVAEPTPTTTQTIATIPTMTAHQAIATFKANVARFEAWPVSDIAGKHASPGHPHVGVHGVSGGGVGLLL
jgi:hypothetical protein